MPWNSVDLPHPERPTRHTISPGATASDTSLTVGVSEPSQASVRLRTSRAGVAARPAAGPHSAAPGPCAPGSGATLMSRVGAMRYCSR